MGLWSRRSVLTAAAAGAGGLLAGCGGSAPHPGEPRSSPPGSSATPPPTPATTPPPTALRTRPPWAQLDRATVGDLIRPRDAAYDRLRITPNPRYDHARPLALLEVASGDDVAAALSFAADHDVPVALRSGGHCYAGWSSGGAPPALVIDTRALDHVSWQGTSVTIGPGAPLSAVYTAVARRGRALAGGSCPTVGLGGLTLGGGVGVLTRAHGLTCDRLTSARVVLADGRIVTASPDSEPDLFWALRGGGGGHLGVVTALTFDTFPAPTISASYLTWSAAAAGDVVPAWFDWMDGADASLWSTLKLLAGTAHPGGPSLAATVTWVGPAGGFDSALAPLLTTHPTGRYDHRRGFLATMRAYAGSGAREAFAATSHIAYRAPDRGQVDTLAARIGEGAGLHEAGVSIDALGGRVRDLAPGDTAFVHRRARATVQYTATYAAGPPDHAIGFVHRLRSAMTPVWGDHAYVNYADPSLDSPGVAYFGDNWARLAQVRKEYDPNGFFTQPQ